MIKIDDNWQLIEQSFAAKYYVNNSFYPLIKSIRLIGNDEDAKIEAVLRHDEIREVCVKNNSIEQRIKLLKRITDLEHIPPQINIEMLERLQIETIAYERKNRIKTTLENGPASALELAQMKNNLIYRL